MNSDLILKGEMKCWNFILKKDCHFLWWGKKKKCHLDPKYKEWYVYLGWRHLLLLSPLSGSISWLGKETDRAVCKTGCVKMLSILKPGAKRPPLPTLVEPGVNQCSNVLVRWIIWVHVYSAFIYPKAGSSNTCEAIMILAKTAEDSGMRWGRRGYGGWNIKGPFGHGYLDFFLSVLEGFKHRSNNIRFLLKKKKIPIAVRCMDCRGTGREARL